MHRSVFVPTLLLALVFVAAKLALAWPYLHGVEDLWKWIGISGEDLATAIVLGAAASITLRLVSRRPTLQKVLWRTFLLIAAAFAIYAIVNVSVVRSLGVPLNVRMFALVGRFTDVRSSIAARSTLGIVTSIVVVIVAFALAAMPRFRIAPTAR